MLKCFTISSYVLIYMMFSIRITIEADRTLIRRENTGDNGQAETCMQNKFINEVSVAMNCNKNTRVYPKVSGLAAWNENCKWYSTLQLGEVVSL
jgi:hypothetical protein